MYTHIHTPTYQKKNQHIKELQRTPTVHTAHKTPSDLHTRTDYTNMSLKKKKREKLSATLMPPTTGLAPTLLLNDFAEIKKTPATEHTQIDSQKSGQTNQSL